MDIGSEWKRRYTRQIYRLGSINKTNFGAFLVSSISNSFCEFFFLPLSYCETKGNNAISVIFCCIYYFPINKPISNIKFFVHNIKNSLFQVIENGIKITSTFNAAKKTPSLSDYDFYIFQSHSLNSRWCNRIFQSLHQIQLVKPLYIVRNILKSENIHLFMYIHGRYCTGTGFKVIRSWKNVLRWLAGIVFSQSESLVVLRDGHHLNWTGPMESDRPYLRRTGRAALPQNDMKNDRPKENEKGKYKRFPQFPSRNYSQRKSYLPFTRL